jgi:Flp pilus assembly protein TadD/TolB-like protein
MLGTPDYMSPEQAKGERAGEQSDLFSFGVVLYEMLTGHLPYQAETPTSRVMMRLTHKPSPPRQLNPEIPKYLEQVIIKCMELDPALRYRGAEEVLADFEREQVDRSHALRARRAISRRKNHLAVAAALVLVAVTTLFLVKDRIPLFTPGSDLGATTLAILPLTNATASEEVEWMRTGIPELLATDLSQSEYVRPVRNERIANVLRELGIEDSRRFDEAALDRVSEKTAAESMLYGQYVESGGKIRLNLTLRKPGSELPIPLQDEGLSAELPAIVDKVSVRIKELLGLVVRGEKDRPVAEIVTSSPEALASYQAALAELQKGSDQGAIALLKAATAEDPDFAMAHGKLAETYLKMGNRQEAKSAIEKAQKISEEKRLPAANRYEVQVTAALVNADHDSAVRAYEELARLYAKDTDILFSLGRSLDELGKIPEALQVYTQVVEHHSGHGEARFYLARSQLLAGRYEDAIRTCREAITADRFRDDFDTLGKIHDVMAVAYREMGMLDEYAEHLDLSREYRGKAGSKPGETTSLEGLATEETSKR